MKLSLVIAFSAVVLVANARGASYVSNFDSFDDQLDVAGNDGWGINDPSEGLSFIVSLNGTNAAALGGYYANPAPTTQTVGLTHSYLEELGVTSMSFDFLLIDQTNTASFRDTFGVTLRNGASDLFTVSFAPVPLVPPESDHKWGLSYSVGNGPTVSLTMAVFEAGLYSLNLQFTPHGSTTDFNLSVGGGNTVVRTGNIAIDPTTVATDFGLTWTPTGGAGNGSNNYFVRDNLAVERIPEVSSSLLLCLAGLGAVFRRRRTC